MDRAVPTRKCSCSLLPTAHQESFSNGPTKTSSRAREDVLVGPFENDSWCAVGKRLHEHLRVGTARSIGIQPEGGDERSHTCRRDRLVHEIVGPVDKHE